MSRIYDLDENALSSAAVKSLNRAMFPSLEGCSIKWYTKKDTIKEKELNEVFYNQIVSSYVLVDRKDFEKGKIKFAFYCRNNPISGRPINQVFAKRTFKEVPSKSGFFKIAVHKLIKQEKDKKTREKLSVKYQVLAPETAMVGVLKRINQPIEIIKIWQTVEQEEEDEASEDNFAPISYSKKSA